VTRLGAVSNMLLFCLLVSPKQGTVTCGAAPEISPHVLKFSSDRGCGGWGVGVGVEVELEKSFWQVAGS
jgi:hypothetical protein